MTAPDASQVARLAEVMATLREQCPWDAEQTHRSLATYLVEETGEVLDAIESGDDTDLREELGDLLLQVVFHAEIARREGRFDLDDVAGDIADKLVRRHPYVYSDGDVPDDLMGSWEQRKRAEKGRTSSLDGIAQQLSSIARAAKVTSRARNHGVAVATDDEPITADEPVTADEVGQQLLSLVQRAQASGVDADQALRDAVRVFEDQVRAAER